jgi:hypothetical protein
MSTDGVNTGPRLAAIAAGIGASGLMFCGWLSDYLNASRRPLSPDAAHGYTSLVHAKHGDVYGTQLEQLAVNPGPLLMIMILLVSVAFDIRFFRVEGRPRPPWPYYIVSATLSMAAFVTLWMLLS